MTTNTKPALTFADQIADLEKIQQSLPESAVDKYGLDPLEDLNEYLGQMIQLMKDWPAELITSKLRESFNITTQAVSRRVQTEEFDEATYEINYLVDHVLPVLSKGDGLEPRLKIAEELTNRFYGDFGPLPTFVASMSECAWPYLSFGMAIKDQRKWSAQLTEKIDETYEEAKEYSELIRKYRDAIEYENSNRKKLGIDPDVELSKELLLDKLNAMEEAKPEAHRNTIASWERAANSLYMLVLYTTTSEEQEEES